MPPESTPECDDLIGESRQIFCNMLYYADIIIGGIIDELRDKDLYKDTVIIFLSDNGAQPPLPIPDPVLGSASGLPMPFRGLKGNAFEGGVRTPAIITGGYLENKYNKKHWKTKKSISCNYNEMVYVADWYAIIAGLTGSLNKDIINDIDGIDLMDNIEQTCGFKKGSKKTKKREEIISIRYLPNNDGLPEIYRGFIRKGDYKFLINPLYSGSPLRPGFVFAPFWVNYDSAFYIEPNETYYRQFNDFDANNFNAGTFKSVCYEDYLNGIGDINVDGVEINGDDLYLFDIVNDNMEACNIAEDNPDLVEELLDLLNESIDSYNGGGSLVMGDLGSYAAIRDTYDCDENTFFWVKSDSPEYENENINLNWKQMFLSVIDEVNACDEE